MVNDIIIIGAGGFGREVRWLIERINAQSTGQKWNILGYVDDGIPVDTDIDGYRILGGVSYLQDIQKSVNVICAIANSVIRQKIINSLAANSLIHFPNLIDPSVVMSDAVHMGRGNIVCANCVLSVNIHLGDFCIFDWNCTVGHDVCLHDYVMAYPNVNISGCVETGNILELGTGTQIIQQVHICDKVIVGAGTVVIRDITESGTYVGSPARRVK